MFRQEGLLRRIKAINPGGKPMPVRVQRLSARYGLDTRRLRLGEFQLSGRKVVAQVRFGAGADDQRSDPRAILEPGQAGTRH